jgi:DNA repair exonuclease SbcCD nuclease subunit
MIESLEENKDSIILNAGDIFDTNRPKFEAIKTLHKINDLLIKKKAKMLYIEGNHDRSPIKDDQVESTTDIKHWTGIFDNESESYGLKHIRSGKFYNINNQVMLMGFCEQPKVDLINNLNQLDYSTKDPEKLYILMLHMSCKEFASFSSEGTLKIDDIPNIEFWDYIIIGDTHIHKAVVKGKTKILSPGSIEMVSSSEPIEKYFYRIFDKDNYSEGLIKTRPCYKFELNGNEVESDFLDKIKDISSQHPLVYLTVPADIIGLNRIMSCFNLDQAIIRIKFKKLNDIITNKEININESDEILSLDAFKQQYIDYHTTNKTLETDVLSYIDQLSVNNELDVAEILTTLKP